MSDVNIHEDWLRPDPRVPTTTLWNRYSFQRDSLRIPFAWRKLPYFILSACYLNPRQRAGSRSVRPSRGHCLICLIDLYFNPRQGAM